MKAFVVLPALLLAAVPGTMPAPVHAAPPLTAPRMAVCAVCREGEEPVLATAVHQGREWTFCSEECKKTFLANPAEFLEATPANLQPSPAQPSPAQPSDSDPAAPSRSRPGGSAAPS